jgi:hypothetical protein
VSVRWGGVCVGWVSVETATATDCGTHPNECTDIHIEFKSDIHSQDRQARR